MPWWDVFGGMVIALVLSKFYVIKLTFFIFLLAAIFCLLPDIDLIIWLKKHRWRIDKWTHEHRDILHYPILYLTSGSLLIWWLANQFYGVLFFSCSLIHFLHDSVGIGWGIRWLFPFSKRNYKFFTRKHLGEKRRLIVSWNPAELKIEVEKRGQDDWFKNKKYYYYT